jgi:TonB family protein
MTGNNQPVLVSDEESGTDAPRSNVASEIVELVVLTRDDVFLQTLREAIGDARRPRHVLSADEVSDLLIAGQVGILVLDVQALSEASSVFVGQIKRQFPDLVVVVAGHRDAETLLAGLISAGTVYRFIHKPLSPGRAKSFVDTAVKKYEEERRRLAAIPPIKPRSRSNRGVLIGGTGVLGVMVAAAWVMHRSGNADPGATYRPAGAVASSAESSQLANAAAALAQVREDLLSKAEEALLAERLDEAAVAIETARQSGVESGRIALLTARLAKSRVRAKTAQAASRLRDESKGAENPVTPLLEVAAPRVDGAPRTDDAPRVDGAQRMDDAQRIRDAHLIDPGPERAPAAANNIEAAQVLPVVSPPHDLAAAAASQPFPANIVPAGELTLVKSVQPIYPPKATLNKVQGWVELDFTVAESGAVQDIAVHAASVRGVFEAAAISALSQWRYQPVLRDAKSVPRRARIRIRFVLAD